MRLLVQRAAGGGTGPREAVASGGRKLLRDRRNAAACCAGVGTPFAEAGSAPEGEGAIRPRMQSAAVLHLLAGLQQRAVCIACPLVGVSQHRRANCLEVLPRGDLRQRGVT
jgi:hypothetical protein